MTTPDATAIQRRTYALTLEDYKPGDAMVVGALTIPGRAHPAKFMGEPEVLEQLVAALDPAPIVAQVVSLLNWSASAMENQGKSDEAIVARRLAQYIAGDISSPLSGDMAEMLRCTHDVDGKPCNKGDAHECHRCSKTFCVIHWEAEGHACMAARRARKLPPPLVPVPAPPAEPSYR